MRVDLHTHSWHSPDGWMSPEHLLRIAKRRGISAVAITDHNKLTLAETDEIIVIRGEEIMTTHGELIGLGITEQIPAGLSPEETTDRILEQGGIVVVPHPYDNFRRKSALLLNYDYRPGKRTAVEALNARYISWKPYEQALAYAIAHNLPVLGASDAHTPWELGRAYTFLHYCDDADCIIRRILKREVVPKGRLSPSWVHGFSPVSRLAHSLHLMPG